MSFIGLSPGLLAFTWNFVVLISDCAKRRQNDGILVKGYFQKRSISTFGKFTKVIAKARPFLYLHKNSYNM